MFKRQIENFAREAFHLDFAFYVKAGQKRPSFRRRGMQKVRRCRKRIQSPVVQEPDAAAEEERLPHIVRDKQGGLVELPTEHEKLPLKLNARDRIERAEGLVKQQERRVCGQRAGHTDPLALPAGQLPGIAPGVLFRGKTDLRASERSYGRGQRTARQPSRRGTSPTLSAIVK